MGEPERQRDDKNEEDDSKHGVPLVKALKRRADEDHAAFYVPGHKRGRGASEQLLSVLGATALRHDLTELDGLDQLSISDGAIGAAQRRAARVFGAAGTFFLVNGSTSGIHAAVLSCCSPQQTLILARNSHMAAYNALVLSGCRARYVLPEADKEFGIAHGVSPDAVQRQLEAAAAAGEAVGAVLIVSPTYFGACSDVAGIARVCHDAGVALIVDEAHGAHLSRHPELPAGALVQGADLVVQSTHKVLSGLTQSAMVHVSAESGRVDHARLSRSLSVLQSSSPSYLLMASLDAATAQAARPQTFDEPLKAAQAIRDGLLRIPSVRVLGSSGTMPPGVAAFDPLRVTLLTPPTSSGHHLAEVLDRRYHVVPEMATSSVLVLALGPGSRAVDAQRLTQAVEAVFRGKLVGDASREDASRAGERSRMPPWVAGAQPALTAREAFFAAQERVRFDDAERRISAELLCPYPPGIPLICPGETISRDVLSYLTQLRESGGTVSGASDSSMETLLVVRE